MEYLNFVALCMHIIDTNGKPKEENILNCGYSNNSAQRLTASNVKPEKLVKNARQALIDRGIHYKEVVMKFDWSNFTKENYNDMLHRKADYCGAVYIGDICIELINESGTLVNGILEREGYVMCNFYVAHEDTGYGYKDNGMPYDYADGFDIEMPYNLAYDEFKAKVEKLSMDYIEAYKGSYSLVEHANRPLEIW